MNIKRQIASAIAAGSIVLNMIAPAYASSTLVISGNGTDSNNNLNITSTNTNTVSQTNTANITNNVTSTGNTGGNEAEDNTNGDVSISTGDSTVGVAVSNTANSNVANIACCTNSGTDLVKILGNGSETSNTAGLVKANENTVLQDNDARVNNNVYASALTGNNEAEDNTGGNVKVKTGDAGVGAQVTNKLNSNAAYVAGCCTGGSSVVIAGNGSDSTNKASLMDLTKNGISQENTAGVENRVDADAKTGKNSVEDNTGGSVEIDTGDAGVSAMVSTTANANKAMIGGGLPGGAGSASVMINGNGSDSNNTIGLILGHENLIWQGNQAEVNNDVDADAKTGKNEAEENTGGNVTIETGDAGADLRVANTVNFNWANLDCCTLGISGEISKNGEDTSNDVLANLTNANVVLQGGQEGTGNSAYLNNHVGASPKTGANEAEDNTGPLGIIDPVEISTGDADSYTSVSNTGNSNVVGGVPGIGWPEFGTSFNFTLSLSQLQLILSGFGISFS